MSGARTTEHTRELLSMAIILKILESDPYKVSPDAIADIKVSETWVAGEGKFAA